MHDADSIPPKGSCIRPSSEELVVNYHESLTAVDALLYAVEFTGAVVTPPEPANLIADPNDCVQRQT